MAFESIDVHRPEATELGEPGVEFLEWSGLQPIEAALCVDGRFDEAGVAKDAEVLGDGRLGHAELTLDLANGLLVEEVRRLRIARRLGSAMISNAFSMVLYMPYNVYTCQGIFEDYF